jgi:site-specific DNA-methyltransferase (adenine-specific)
MKQIKLMQGDNILSLKKLPENSIDSIVTDAPYGLGKEQDMNIVLKDWIEKGYSEIKGKGFMQKEWDAFVPQPLFWKEVYRVLKPGGHILCFFGTRTYDIGTMAMRLAGFEIRDQIMWIYGSGFPKSLNIGKSFDKLVEKELKKQGVDKVEWK